MKRIKRKHTKHRRDRQKDKILGKYQQSHDALMKCRNYRVLESRSHCKAKNGKWKDILHEPHVKAMNIDGNDAAKCVDEFMKIKFDWMSTPTNYLPPPIRKHRPIYLNQSNHKVNRSPVVIDRDATHNQQRQSIKHLRPKSKAQKKKNKNF